MDEIFYDDDDDFCDINFNDPHDDEEYNWLHVFDWEDDFDDDGDDDNTF